jgi:hypothetical protein
MGMGKGDAADWQSQPRLFADFIPSSSQPSLHLRAGLEYRIAHGFILRSQWHEYAYSLAHGRIAKCGLFAKNRYGQRIAIQ